MASDLSIGSGLFPTLRLINQPNPTLWNAHSPRQSILPRQKIGRPTAGPALTLTNLVPDLHHYNGRGGRAHPLWRDQGRDAAQHQAGVVDLSRENLRAPVKAEDVMAYVTAVMAHPAFTTRFAPDLVRPDCAFL